MRAGCVRVHAGRSGRLRSALAYRVFIEQEILALQAGLWPVPAGITLIADPLGVFMLVMTQLVLAAGILYGTGTIEKVAQYPTFVTAYPANRVTC